MWKASCLVTKTAPILEVPLSLVRCFYIRFRSFIKNRIKKNRGEKIRFTLFYLSKDEIQQKIKLENSKN